MSLRFLPPFVCLLGAYALGGCASLSGPDLPTCDGTARRPANPYGSVLTPDPATSPQAVAPAHAKAPQTGGCT
ncbi:MULTISPECIES: hypothetical protein [unclassified Brevundimonas]|uniref:hypothetical protein n=1 Tax=unclassified Brevundimonas TaxID=2622653 RepID=UPI000CFB79DA|nr:MULTISPECIES: hypothetical protein [unclassified Brevundimonas]PQZ74969.1 hypothetical protein CQ026_15185 [Brevundimonas sp. MYb31]PRB17615.1 hypothetical protein CQ039_00825 [Brevundimonas sp. MYb52]PRB45383.1 hypothetical protein CQ028_13160 [Brevundimonas sp. MYb33]